MMIISSEFLAKIKNDPEFQAEAARIIDDVFKRMNINLSNIIDRERS